MTPPTIEAQLSATGRWTPPSISWGNTQIHLALLRGDATHHSKIISWGKGQHGVPLAASLWGWNPSTTTADGNCTVYPSASSFQSLALDQTMVNLFCTGHSTLADGTLLIGGGHDRANIVGLRQSTILRQNAPTGQQWAPQGDMAQERWYPTQTTMPDGKVMTFAGSRFYHMVGFGGTRDVSGDATATRDTIEQIGLTPSGRWMSPVRDATPNWPAPREGHTAVWRPDSNMMIIFGGRGSDGFARNDTWRLKVELEGDVDGNPPLLERYKYTWSQISASGSPPRRKQHVAVVRGNNRVVTYGGKDGSIVRSDVYELSNSGTSWSWVPKATVGTSPGARYGHAAVIDTPNDQMLVFGGSIDQSGTLADNDLYSLTLTPGIQVLGPPEIDTLTWTRFTLGLEPPGRSGHTLVLDPFLRDGPDADLLVDDRRAVMFGARNASDPDKIWELWLTGDNGPEWRALDNPPGGPPSGLKRHAAFWDRTAQNEVDRMVVFGGENGGAAISGAWALDHTLTTWTQLQAPQPAVPLAGHTAMFHSGGGQALYLMALDSEKFTPGSPGSWSAQDDPRWQPTYPLMFVLPSGNLFQAGASWETYIYETDSTAYWKQVPPKPPAPASPTLAWSNVRGGSGVQFRPGEIMKCGNEPFEPLSGKTDRIKFNAQDQILSADWDLSANEMQPRNYHNLTMLPNGKVLVTGGLPNHLWAEKDSGAVRGPQIWDPYAGGGAGQWTAYGVLDSNEARRGYHSTAILLPDGRVLSAGGEPDILTKPVGSDANSTKATIFCPPYLFKPSGELAARPVILGSHTEIGYGQNFAVTVGWDMPIQSACLIRPGAVTHGFNQDQYFLPLQFTTPTNCSLSVASPANANYAPPGDYLLFVTTVEATTGEWVPSIGKWVRLRDGALGANPPPVSCEIPGGCPMVDARTAQGWTHENSILGRSLTGEHSTDVYRLRTAPQVVDGRLQLRIRENEREYTTLDQVRLWTVDHDAGLQAFASAGGVVLGERRPAHRVTTTDGRDVTHLFDGSGEMFQGEAGDTLLVELTAPRIPGVFAADGEPDGGGEGLLEEPCCEKNGVAPGGFRLAQDPSALAAQDQRVLTRTGVVVQVPDGEGSWRTLQHRYPREREDQLALELGGQRRMRLIFMGRQRLRFVGRVARTGEAKPQEVTLIAARHSRLGDALQPVIWRGGSATALDPGDTLHLEFAASLLPEGKVRDWFLVSTGVYTSDPAKADRVAGTQVVPARFALAQNRPNPFSNATTIRFDLPVAAKVKLEVFDLLGRRMATLANREYPPGYHAVEWDRHGAAPGVYLYRITAGRFKDQKKMTLLP